MEIERKFVIEKLPDDINEYPSKFIEQAYILRDPVIRIRRAGDHYLFTVKGNGKMAREEHEMPLTEESYNDLMAKTEGNIIRKKRYFIPYPPFTIELDVFEEPFDDMMMAEVEFLSVREAEDFVPPEWFGEDVTQDSRYHNSSMSNTYYPGNSFRRGRPMENDSHETE